MNERHARAWARVIAGIHVGYMALMLASLPLALLYDWYKVPALILSASLFAIWIFFRFDCPLSELENALRRKARLKPKYPDFISHHLREMRIPFTTPVMRLTVYPYVATVILVSLLG